MHIDYFFTWISCWLNLFFLRKLVTSSIYNISVTKISVGGTDADLEFTAVFDSGTSFTYLNDPAYSLISESVSSFSNLPLYLLEFKVLLFAYLLLMVFLQFNNLVTEKRHSSTSNIPFEYCYDIRSIICSEKPPLCACVFFSSLITDFNFECSPNQTEMRIPAVNLVMKGGSYFNTTDPIVIIELQVTCCLQCSGIFLLPLGLHLTFILAICRMMHLYIV